MVVAHPSKPGGAGAEAPVVRASVLGRFEVHLGDRPLARADWQRLSAERLVKLLLVTRGHVLSRERATELLWPDADPATGGATFRKALHYAHRALDESGALRSDGRTVALVAGRLDLDLDRLADAFTAIESSADEQRRAEAIAVILDLGAADLLPDDPYEEWLVGPRERLRSRCQDIALVAARRASDQGDVDRALGVVEQVLERDPADEAAHRLAIALYARDGRHHAARRQYQLCKDALRRELDVEPSDETRAAFEAAERAARASPSLPRPPRLVARRSELEQVEALLDRVAGGRAAALVLHGPVGIGKTRLLREVSAYAGAAGWRVAWWQATDLKRAVPYAQTSAALAALAPGNAAAAWEEPGRSAAATLRSAGGDIAVLPFMTPSALLAGIVAAFDSATRDGPVVIAVDDLPWIHDASLEALRAVHGALADRPILLAVTCRDGDAWPPGTTVFVEEIRRAGGLRLAVGPLGPRDMEPLIVANLGGRSVHTDVARSAYLESAGNPLFCLEIVQSARDRGSVRLESGRWVPVPGVPLADIPPTVQRLVAERSGSLAPATLELLATAAELGSSSSYATLAAVGGMSNGELLVAIDEAVSSGLLVERGDGYAFPHPLYRRAVAERRGQAHRATRQLEIAAALAGPDARSASPSELWRMASRHPNPAPVADHALAAASAGAVEARQIAVAFGFWAGERLSRLFDLAGATGFLERTLACWRQLDPDVAVAFDASRACRVLGELRAAAGEDAAARAAILEAIAIARDTHELAEGYTALKWLPYQHGDFEAALAIIDEGLARLPDDAAAERAQLQGEAAWCLVRVGRRAQALPLLEQSVAVLESASRPLETMRALDLLGDLLGIMRRFDEAIVRLSASLALALELRDARGEILARAHLGATLTRAGRPARARPHLARALELAHLVGDRYVESVTSWLAANAEHALGNLAAAAELRRNELALLAVLGGNPHHEAMSHAHLAHLARLAGDAETERQEAAAARRLAPQSSEPRYADRIEAVLADDDWSPLDA